MLGGEHCKLDCKSIVEGGQDADGERYVSIDYEYFAFFVSEKKGFGIHMVIWGEDEREKFTMITPYN